MVIQEGMEFNIEPSMAFQGITPGDVKVMRVCKYAEVKGLYADPEYLLEADPSLKNVKWVVYRYVDQTTPDTKIGYCLDEETFKEHVTKK